MSKLTKPTTTGILHKDELLYDYLIRHFALNVKEWGAVGDGEHDDADAIERMLQARPNHAIIKIPAGMNVRIGRKIVYGGRRLEIFGESGMMTNKVITDQHSQLFCDVENDFAISCTSADIMLKDLVIKGIPQYAMGVIGNHKGIETQGGSIQTSFVTWLGFASSHKVSGGYYNKYWNNEWLACKVCTEQVRPYNTSFFGCRVAGVDKFMRILDDDQGMAGNGSILFDGCSFENFTQAIIEGDSDTTLRYQNIAFRSVYFENFDDQTVYDGLTARGAGAQEGPWLRHYVDARVIVGIPWSLTVDEGCTVYLKGIENFLYSVGSYPISRLDFKGKLIESKWGDSPSSGHKKPLCVLRVSSVRTADVDYQTTAGTGMLGFPFLSPNNTDAITPIESGSVKCVDGKYALVNAVQTKELTFSSAQPNVNTYQDVNFDKPVDTNSAWVTVTSKSAVSAPCQVWLQELVAGKRVRIHFMNNHSSAADFKVKLSALNKTSN